MKIIIEKTCSECMKNNPYKICSKTICPYERKERREDHEQEKAERSG